MLRKYDFESWPLNGLQAREARLKREIADGTARVKVKHADPDVDHFSMEDPEVILDSVRFLILKKKAKEGR